jgi:hypothetical protein
MERVLRTALPVVGLLWLLFLPASASAGYDIAHIVERTCEPGGPLIVADEWKDPQDRDRVITEPGEVIACPPTGPENSFQIAAAPERIGREPYLCTYFSLFNGDGADICFNGDGAASLVEPLMAIRAGRADPLALAGIVSDDVATVALGPTGGGSLEPMLVPIEAQRAERLGATSAFSYFSLSVERRTVCADERPQLVGRGTSGRVVAESPVPISTPLVDATDRVPYARSLQALCDETAGGEGGRDRDRASALGGGGDVAPAGEDGADRSSPLTSLAIGGLAAMGLLLTLALLGKLSVRVRQGRTARRAP